MGISIMSYAGTVMVGIMTDACLVPDPMTIAENFNVELREMEGWLAARSCTQRRKRDARAAERGRDLRARD